MYNNPWKWVSDFSDDLKKAGESDSAKLIHRVSDYYLDGYPEKTLALLPEAKILAKNLNNPWLEIHFGHCEMRTRVGNLLEGEAVLPDVVTLFEKANQEDTKDSPFSFCITHDMVGCYSNIDGPGWAKERIDTCFESLSQISPKRTCYMCIMTEVIDIYIDQKQYQDGLDFLDQHLEKMENAGVDLKDWEYGYGERSTLLMNLGRYEEALDLLEKAIKIKDSPWRDVRITDSIKKSHLLSLLGRTEEAFEYLPPFNVISPSNRVLWLKTIQQLYKASPSINNWQLANASKETVDYFSNVGSHRHTINAAHISIEMALERNAIRKAQLILDIAKSHLPKLKLDLGASDLLQDLQTKIDNCPHVTLPVPANELLTFLEKKENRDPEEEAELLLQAMTELPNNEELCAATAEALAASDEKTEAERILKNYLSNNPIKTGPVLSNYTACLFEQNKLDELKRFADSISDTISDYAHYLYCQLARINEDWQGLIECALAAMPHKKLMYPHRYLALAYMKKKMFSQAVETYQSLLEEIDDPEQHYPVKWDMMVAASADKNWLLVKQIAASLDIECEVNDQPFEEDFGIVNIVYQQGGEEFSYYARRTGPVTATIIEHASTKKEQSVGELVVFNPQMLYPEPEPDTEESKNFIPSFSLEHVLHQSEYAKSCYIQGPAPEEEKFRTLAQNAENLGWSVWVEYSDEEIIDTTTDKTYPQLVFSIAQKRDEDPKLLERFLIEQTKSWELPMIWIGLADTLKQDLQPQFDLLERYGLT